MEEALVNLNLLGTTGNKLYSFSSWEECPCFYFILVIITLSKRQGCLSCSCVLRQRSGWSPRTWADRGSVSGKKQWWTKENWTEQISGPLSTKQISAWKFLICQCIILKENLTHFASLCSLLAEKGTMHGEMQRSQARSSLSCARTTE